jgi:hypothetical protein
MPADAVRLFQLQHGPFRRYPVYASGSEPAGYLQQLAQAEPELTFDPAKLKTEQAWVDACREVFRYPITTLPIQALPALRGILERSGVPAARDGTYPQQPWSCRRRVL